MKRIIKILVVIIIIAALGVSLYYAMKGGNNLRTTLELQENQTINEADNSYQTTTEKAEGPNSINYESSENNKSIPSDLF